MNDDDTRLQAPTGTSGVPGRRRAWRWLFAGASLLLALVLVLVAWVGNTASGARFLVAQVPLPPTLTLGRVEGSLRGGLRLDRFRWADEGYAVEGADVRLLLRPDWDPRGLRIVELELRDLDVRLAPGAEAESETIDPDTLLEGVALPLPIDVQALRIDGLTVATPDGAWAARRLVARGHWYRSLERLELVLDAPGIEARLVGALALAAGNTDLALEAEVDGSRWFAQLPPDLVLGLRHHGDWSRLPLSLRSSSLELAVDGQVLDPLGDARVEAFLELGRWPVPGAESWQATLEAVSGDLALSPGAYRLDLAGRLSADGVTDLPVIAWRLAGEGDGERLEVHGLSLESALGQLSGEGRIGWAEETAVDLSLNWTDLRWPAGPQPALVSSDQGRGQVSGWLEDWTFDCAFGLATPDYPAGQVSLSARGDGEGARLERMSVRALGGRLDADGQVEWSHALAVEGRFELSQLDLGALWPEWPATLDARGTVTGILGDAPSLVLDLDRLGGRFQGEALDGAGELRWNAGAWQLETDRLALGTSAVSGAVTLGEEVRGEVNVDIRRPGWVAEQLGAEAQGRVAFDSTTTLLIVAADLEVMALDRPGLAAKRLALRREGERIDLSSEGLVVGGTALDRAELTLVSGEGEDRFGLDIEAGEEAFSARLDGILEQDPASPWPAWSGTIESLALRSGERPLIVLRAPAELRVARDGWRVSDACLRGPEEGALCVLASGRPGESLDLDLRLEQLSLALVRHYLDLDLRSTHRLDGVAEWHWRHGTSPSGQAAIDIGAGSMGRPGDEDGLVSTERGFLGFVLDEGNLEGGRIDLPLAGAGHVRADFRIDGVRLDGTGKLTGQLDLDLEDLSFLDAFVSAVDDMGGSLRSRLSLGGTVGDPRFDGGVDLSGGRFRIPALRTGVSDLALRGRVVGEDRLTLRGSFDAGAGSGRLGLETDFGDSSAPRVRATVKGENLAAARLPDLDLDLNPDVAVDWDGSAWRISGVLDIPRALVRPLTSFVSRVDESTDVVVVAGERQPVLAESQTKPAQLVGTLAVRLGEDVRLVTNNADLGLGGGLDLAWDGELAPAATGLVTVDGAVTAWGPRLVIEEGRVRWDQDPVGNPELDVRAQRDVFGNTQVRSAGVRVSGTARRPEVEAYTRPLTTSERAWAVLLTGSDVNFAQGVGALDVGTYIAPRLFLSYGISLFDSENVVGLRYDLRRGWGVKATSGQRESGVDLSYTIED